MKKFGLNILVFAIVSTLVAAGGSLLWLKQIGARALSVQSGSMAPAIKKGDLVIVKSVPHYQAGDVITFISPQDRSTTITHRIIGTDEKTGALQTKGDANHRTDQAISRRMVVGKVHHTLPSLGHAIDFIRKPIGLLLIVYVPALLVVAHELRLLSDHYKKIQPYLAPGHKRRRQRQTGKGRLAFGTKLTACFMVAMFGVVMPARAALFSQASLTGNNIMAVAPTLADNILLRRVEFECSLDNTGEVNKLPSIIMYNPTNQDISTGNWYIESSGGRIVTFRPQTVFDSKDDYDIEPDLTAGLNYQGDFLALFDSTGTLVDAISWGTDTTFLDPSLPNTQDGNTFRRVDLALDTNSANDWAVSVEICTP